MTRSIGAPRGGREITRRLLLLIALVAAGVGIMYQRNDLVRLERIDLGQRYSESKSAAPPVVHLLEELSGALSVQAQGALAGMSREAEKGPTLHPMDDPVMAPARTGFDKFQMVLTGGVRFELLELHLNDRETPGSWRLRRPFFIVGISALLIGLVFYLLFRWRRTATDLLYAKRLGIWAADISAGFFALLAGWVIASVLTGDENILLLFFSVPLTVGAAVLFAMGVGLSTQRWRVSSSEILYTTALGQTSIAFANLRGYHFGHFKRSSGLPVLFIVLGFMTIAAPLIGLSMLLRMQPQIHLFTSDGRTIVKSVESLEGLESFLAALEEHGVERFAEPPVVLEDR